MNSFSDTINHTIEKISSNQDKFPIEGQPSAQDTGEERESCAVQAVEASEDRYLEENYRF